MQVLILTPARDPLTAVLGGLWVAKGEIWEALWGSGGRGVAKGAFGGNSYKKSLCFTMIELATWRFVETRREQVSPSIDF